jgi:MFS family permease
MTPAVPSPETSARARLPRPVWLLGWVSFFTDLASEAIYPLLPAFLSTVLGAGAVALGLIEGVAEATASVLKIVSGRLSDRWRVRKPIVLAGYSLSSAVRPLMAMVTVWPHVLALRFVDRMGKGVRGAPRDAMLADLATPESRGRVFGLNRAMDHAGAVAGPLLASLFLLFYPGEYRTLFALTLVPGIVVILIILRVPEVASADAGGAATRGEAARPGRWRDLPATFFRLEAVILLFTLGNSTDAFLLLRLGEEGIPIALIPAVWAALHVVKSAASVPGGVLSDRLGRRGVIAAGWVIYAVVYAGFAVSESPVALVVLFLAYGLYYGFAESAERAMVADLAPRALSATAFGIHNAVTGFGSLFASVVFGLVWTTYGAPAAFALGAALAIAASTALIVVRR